MDTLESVEGMSLPSSVYGPDVVPVTNHFAPAGSSHRSFEEMVGKPMNWMARQPHFIHQYADALDQTPARLRTRSRASPLDQMTPEQRADADKLASRPSDPARRERDDPPTSTIPELANPVRGLPPEPLPVPLRPEAVPTTVGEDVRRQFSECGSWNCS